MISLVVEDDGDDEFGWFAFVLEVDIDLSDVGAGSTGSSDCGSTSCVPCGEEVAKLGRRLLFNSIK